MDPDGATIEMRVTDGTGESGIITATIEPLPERQGGEWDDYVSSLRGLVKTTAQEYGLQYPHDLDHRVNNPEITEAPYVPLVLAHRALESDDEALSLDGAQFEPEALELVERIIRHMDLASELDHYRSFAQSEYALIEKSLELVGTQPLPEVGELLDYASQAQNQTQMLQQGIAPQSGGLTDWFSYDDGTLTIDTLFDVDGPKHVQFFMELYHDGWYAQRWVDAGLQAADYTITAVALGGAIATGGTGTAAGLAGRTAAREGLKKAVTLTQYGAGVTRMGLGLLPCCMHEINAELYPESGVVETEDEEDEVVRVDGVNARMENDGTDFGKEFFERIALNKVGGEVSEKAVEEMAANFGEEVLIDAGFRELFGEIDVDAAEVRFVWESVDISGTFASPLNNEDEIAINWDLEGFAGQAPTFEIHNPGPGDVNFAQIPFQYDALEFFGREADETFLHVRPDEEFYTFDIWHPPLPEDSALIRGAAIDVTFEPEHIQSDDDDDEPIEFSVLVRNADDPSIDPEELKTTPDLDEPGNAHLGQIEGPESASEIGGGVYEYEYVYYPPDDLDGFETVTVETEAESTQGVRSRVGEPRPRRGSMFIRTDGVELAVSPQQLCLNEGQTQTFEAVDALTGEAQEVTWDVDVGAMSGATFTAPSYFQGGGSATVTASLASDAQVTAEANVSLSCECWYDAEVGGNIGQSYAAAPMGIRFDEDTEALERITLLEVTIDRHDMWDDTPDGSALEGGERSLSLNVNGQVRRLGAEEVSNNQTQVVVRESGSIDLDMDGEFWGNTNKSHFCQPVLDF